jgi:hypothetical protein
MKLLEKLFIAGIAMAIVTGAASCDRRNKQDIQLDESVHISHVDDMTPELFIRITIQYQRENRVWIETSRTMASEEQREYLDRMSDEFFSRTGITEQQYLAYGEQHADELDAYVQEHPELMRALLKEE